ncbi:hypothetical protein TNCV_1298061 [Trichonephila clavipes]|nr:hypothetical protein TNCV_1298061 [Trichonephila clavipes]
MNKIRKTSAAQDHRKYVQPNLYPETSEPIHKENIFSLKKLINILSSVWPSIIHKNVVRPIVRVKNSYSLLRSHPYCAASRHYSHRKRALVYVYPTICHLTQGFLCHKICRFLLSKWDEVSSNFYPDEDSMRIVLSATFQLITEKNTPSLLYSVHD